MAGGFEQSAQDEPRIIAIVRLCLLSYYLRAAGWVFSLGKKRGRSLQIAKTESVTSSLVIAECNFDSHYWEQTAQTEKAFFNHSIHHNVPSKKQKKSIIMFKCSNCTQVKYKSSFAPCSLPGECSVSDTQCFFSKFYFDMHLQD